MRSTLSSSCSNPAFRSSPRGPEPPPEAPYVHRPHSVHPRRGGGVKGGVAAERSEGTLDAAEHRGLLVGRWTPRSVGVAGIELKEIRSNRPRSGPPQSQKSRADGSDRMSTMFFHTCPRNRIKIKSNRVSSWFRVFVAKNGATTKDAEIRVLGSGL